MPDEDAEEEELSHEGARRESPVWGAEHRAPTSKP